MKTPVTAVVVATVVGAGCASPPRPTAGGSTPVTVAVGRATMADLASTFEAGGVVRPHATALVASRMMAPITQVHVRPGDRVRRGSVLVILDARAVLADKGRAEASSRSAAEAARAADAEVRASESALVLARATHDRMVALHATRSATAQELDQAVAALEAADAQRTSALARRAAANAAGDAARDALEAAAITATYASLLAPFDGVVTERLADPGTMATPGMPLLTVEDPSAYRLEVRLDEARAVLVQTGQAVEVRIDRGPGGADSWIPTRVGEIARVDPVSHNSLIKIDLAASANGAPPARVDASLRSGLFGRARFAGRTRRALVVPRSALVPRGQLTFVYVIDAEDRARLRPISPGVSDHDRTEVLAGLREGDAIATSPPASLIDGTKINRGPASAEASVRPVSGARHSSAEASERPLSRGRP